MRDKNNFKFNSKIYPVILILFMFSFCNPFSKSSKGLNDNGDNDNSERKWVEENKLLDDTFRIDISEIDVVFRFNPEQGKVYGKANVKFRMRNGQNFPIIHFDPAFDNAVNKIVLDGDSLIFSDTGDVRPRTFDDTKQKGLEFQRDCSDGKVHEIEIEYTLEKKFESGRFFTDVNDISGNGNEDLFPTINTPAELSRHKITFIVESSEKYRCIGSGLVENKSDKNIQKWELDTEREIASYTIMFIVIPESETDFRKKSINGVDVRVIGYKDTGGIDNVFDQLESWLPELEKNIGKFPMPRGLSVFLTRSGGGMEYYGGTMTSLYALKHEVFHMYYGCSLIAKTYRDSWWDEAINMWYELNAKGDLKPIGEQFRSNIVSGRTPVSIGFDDRAYDAGAQIIEYCSDVSGGRNKFISFLHYLYGKYKFSPFNTFGLVEYFKDYSGVDLNSKFLNWLYNSVQTYYSGISNIRLKYHKVNMTPPQWIIDKYKKR